MFAVIKTGGKQYTIKEGDIINVEKLEVEVGATHKFEEVLFISGDKQTAGSPFVKGASIEVEVLEHGKADRVYICTFPPKYTVPKSSISEAEP